MWENINQNWLLHSSLTITRVTGQKGYLFPSDYIIWVVSQMHVETVATIFVFNTSLVLGFSFIPPLRILPNVAERTIQTRYSVTNIFPPICFLRFSNEQKLSQSLPFLKIRLTPSLASCLCNKSDGPLTYGMQIVSHLYSASSFYLVFDAHTLR